MRRLWLQMAMVAALFLAGGCTDTSVSRTAAPLRPTAFVNVSLVPMTSESVVANRTVLIEEGRIAAIRPSGSADIPPGAMVVDGRGAFLMPGLADMHMHARAGWLDGSWPVSPFALYLANGVTTVRHFGTSRPTFTKPLTWRDEIARGELAGPRMFVGALLGREPIDDVRSFVERRAGDGFDFIKLYSFLSKQQFAEAVRTANHVGLRTVGHIPFAVGLDGVLAAGMDEIAHVEELDFEFLDFDRERRLRPREWFKYLTKLGARQTAPFERADGIDLERFNEVHRARVAAVMGKLRAANVPIATTLVVGETIVRKLWHREAYLARPENRYLPAAYWAEFDAGREKHLRVFKGHERFARAKYQLETALLRELAEAGVPLVLGTDAGTGAMGIVPGFSMHDELRILVENGFSPYQAILTATAVASEVAAGMTDKDEFGTIELGKRADLLLVGANPLESITHLKSPIGVMAGGRWYPGKRLREMIGLGD